MLSGSGYSPFYFPIAAALLTFDNNQEVRIVMRDPNKRPKVGVGLMMIRKGKILLGMRKRGYGALTFGWAGGHLEFGESFEDCARREVSEETGLSIVKLRLISICNIVTT